VFVLCCCWPRPVHAADDILLADFEGKDYGDWKATGAAFGTGPARGTLPNQMPVSGYLGEGLVNSFYGGDGTEGTLTSPEFKIGRKRINFLIGGGNHPGQTCMNLLVDGKVVHTATGRDSEHLLWHSWDVADLAGKTARLEIVDRHTGGWGHVLIDHVVQSDQPPAIPDDRDELLKKAEASVKAAAEKVKDDPNHPVYHLLPPANWMNDPNGPLFHEGWYHLFYQHNPYGDDWGHMHWGHFRSKDLVHWEHLPIALAPSKNRGEDHVFSGCATVNRKGEVMLFYTSIGGRLPEQWAAVPEDKQLLKWKKHPANPILTEQLHDGVKVHEWRDPFIFHHEDRTYLVLGGNLNGSKGGQAVVNVYRAENDELTRWKYHGVLFQHPDAAVKNIECPLFFKLGDRWCLVVSPHGPVGWFLGELDGKTMTFKAEKRGVLDHGNYYAPNCMEDAKGRRLVWGWVNGFPAGRGWNGCLTLPRVLTPGPDDLLRQEPAPELEKLRGEHTAVGPTALADTSRVLDKVHGDTLEIVAEFAPGDAKACGLKVRRSGDGSRAVVIRWDGREIDVAGSKAPLQLARGETSVRLHLFLDRSVIEVYASGQACITRVVAPQAGDVGVEVFATGGKATLKGLDAWTMKSIWH
jgi:sucrose-6-phosphate hydrolase SacC (GH32 family)